MLLAFALDAFGIRSTSGVDSRPSGLISVHSTFESHDRPHRTCWPPHFQGVVEARSQPQAECTQKIMRPTTLPYRASATLQHLQEDAEGIKMQLCPRRLDAAPSGSGPGVPRAVSSAALPKPCDFAMSQSQLKSPRAAG